VDGAMEKTAYESIVIVSSYHHMNTEKIALAIADVLKSEIRKPEDVCVDELSKYRLVGFGSGIDSGTHYKPLLELADSLHRTVHGKAFIFSTSAMVGNDKVARDHKALRNILLSKGYTIVDELGVKGFNTNSFLKYFGGMNKGRPNEEDVLRAQSFARNLKVNV
jgi:flavodoxin